MEILVCFVTSSCFFRFQICWGYKKALCVVNEWNYTWQCWCFWRRSHSSFPPNSFLSFFINICTVHQFNLLIPLLNIKYFFLDTSANHDPHKSLFYERHYISSEFTGKKNFEDVLDPFQIKANQYYCEKLCKYLHFCFWDAFIRSKRIEHKLQRCFFSV